MNTQPAAIITNKRRTRLIEHDCDGPFETFGTFAEITCPNCGHTRPNVRIGYIGHGDGDDCPNCKREYYYLKGL